LIDPNRGEDDPTLIMKLSDGMVIPANHPLAPDERERRLNGFHRPYHDAVSTVISRKPRANPAKRHW
jgi:predicted N-formylglutamate amidohydrolase